MAFCLAALYASNGSDINSALALLKERKLNAEKNAIYHENQGQRLQFLQGQLQYAKRHFKAAAASRKMAADIQAEIDKLEGQKGQKKEQAYLIL